MKTDGISTAKGFSIIELLTVIAIISILASLTAVTLPRVIERAKIATTENTFAQLRTILTEYFADNSSYPARYGYLRRAALGKNVLDVIVNNPDWDPRDDPPQDPGDYITRQPYMLKLREFRDFGLYDNWSTSYDTDRDEEISLLEFSPLGNKTIDTYKFTNGLYDPNGDFGGQQFAGQQENQLKATQRPIMYIPVNKRQAARWGRFWLGIDLADPRPRSDDNLGVPDAVALVNMTFPPATYDAFVLMSVGPQGNAAGIMPRTGDFSNYFGPGRVDNKYKYHAMGIMAYFMATRDADDNGKLDFDYRERTRGGEGTNLNNKLFDPSDPVPDDPLATGLPGPLIFASN